MVTDGYQLALQGKALETWGGPLSSLPPQQGLEPRERDLNKVVVVSIGWFHVLVGAL